MYSSNHYSDAIPIKVIKFHDDAKLPAKANLSDLGFDLFAVEDVVLSSTHTTKVRTGINFFIPDCGLMIRDRSSMAAKGVLTSGGIIDNGYRGEILVLMHCLSGSYAISKGDKIAQAIPICMPRVSFYTANYSFDFAESSESVNNTERGDKGFGSSGK